MGGTRRSRLLIPLLIALVAGCSPGGTGGGTAPGAGGGGGGGNISAIDVCALLTSAEIEQALGSAMKPGVKETLTGNASGCDWDAQSEAAGLSLSVKITPFDQTLWDGETTTTGNVAVPGIGELAFRGFVSNGVMLIKKGGMEVDLQIVAIFLDEKKMEAGQETLAKLAVSRL